MKRYLLTSTKFTGTAEIWFNGLDILCRIDTTQTDMDIDTVTAFKKAVPPSFNLLAGRFTSETTIVEATIDITFEMFWDKYNKKINKERAVALWKKLTTTDKVLAYYGIEQYDNYLRLQSWRTKADPETYLKQKYWQTEWSKL